jgi:hypothetical protein
VNRFASLRALCCLLLLLPGGAALAAVTPQQLVDEGHLQVEAHLSPETGIVPGQRIELSLTLSSDTWFTGGTRIALPEVAGLVVLQTEQFASNSSEYRDNRSWVQQRWTLDVYPQRAGSFTLPAITARVSVNGGDAGDVAGPVHSQPLNFKVELPAELEGISQWVASPDFEVSQQFDRELDQLRVGDAFERQILFRASDLMAMMLPVFTPAQQPGLAAYPEPPVLENSSNRGRSEASRRERISYLVQAEGEYLLPAVDYFWWNTASGKLELRSLPAITVTVGAGAAATGDRPLQALRDITPRQLLLAALGLVILFGALWLARRLLPRLPLAQLAAAARRCWRRLRALREPGLPRRLNPGSNAGE